jgi:hypothetical protein
MWDESFDKDNDEWALTQAIQHAAVRDFFARQDITFEEGNKTFHVDSKTRHEVGTLDMAPGFGYDDPLPFAFIAVNIKTGKDEHCVILTTEMGWVRTSLEKGKKVIAQFENADM